MKKWYEVQFWQGVEWKRFAHRRFEHISDAHKCFNEQKDGKSWRIVECKIVKGEVM